MGNPNGHCGDHHNCGAIGWDQEKPSQPSTPLIALARLLARKAAREAATKNAASQTTNCPKLLQQENGDG